MAGPVRDGNEIPKRKPEANLNHQLSAQKSDKANALGAVGALRVRSWMRIFIISFPTAMRLAVDREQRKCTWQSTRSSPVFFSLGAKLDCEGRHHWRRNKLFDIFLCSCSWFTREKTNSLPKARKRQNNEAVQC